MIDRELELYMTAMLQAFAGEYENALESIDKVIELNPAFKQAYIERDTIKREFAEDHYTQGLEEADLDLHKDAVFSFDQAIELVPNHSDAWKAREKSQLLILEENVAIELEHWK